MRRGRTRDGLKGVNIKAARGSFLTKKKSKTYNSEDSLVVTHPTTNSPACGLSTAERTGSPVFHTLWSYVSDYILGRIIRPIHRESISRR
ncbi:uncharacterized protein N7487_011814 [Penicillium crustosum]|uniref:uncharacterized protein n=1 Tax=Penicillium crustosum TaxID=36656 RepID=UPI00238EB7BF|nr:uncharacterized protein N7487_011814 [Penicillium crustosum]KAJ5394173.1 hypothetical protein N7487_011814 [Penicillium crustosum]